MTRQVYLTTQSSNKSQKWEHFDLLFSIFRVCVDVTQCLKITQNVAFEFFIFVLSKLTCLVTLFDRKLQVFKNSPKWTILGIFN